MNRIILIGNGFDLAHGLPTSYKNFIDWYWRDWKSKLLSSGFPPIDDDLCEFDNKTIYDIKSFIINAFGYNIYNLHGYEFGKKLLSFDFDKNRFVVRPCTLLKEIHKSVETKGWVDVENEYYKLLIGGNVHLGCTIKELNSHLRFLQEKLIYYLNSIRIEGNMHQNHIAEIIYSPIKNRYIAVSSTDRLVEHIYKELTCTENDFLMKIGLYGYNYTDFLNIKRFRNNSDLSDSIIRNNIFINKYPQEYFLPDEIMFLNFNYTSTAKLYLPTPKPGFEINHIHGELSKPESIIFGYGDELDENYKKISNLNDNEYLTNFKSIKYLESDRYRKALQFMDAAPYQVFIMGHSCGNSDRTLLNTLFEHKNCVSIKPYYYKDGDKDNYLEIVQNISRNFKDMKLMRDRVVNKTYCEPFSERVS